MIVYLAENILNHKKYVGKTIGVLNKRISKHIFSSKQNSNTYFHNAIRKYGPHNFKWEILGYCETKEELNEAEKICIEHFKSNDKRYGYNLTNGGDGTLGCKLSNEHRQKLSIALKGKNKGKVCSEDKKLKLRNVNLGKIKSEETKQKMSRGQIGKIRSIETRKKMGLAKIGNKYAIGITP